MLYEVFDGDKQVSELSSIYEAVGFAKSYRVAGYSESPKMKIALVLFDSAEIDHGAMVNMDEKIKHLQALVEKLELLKPRMEAGTDAGKQSGSD